MMKDNNENRNGTAEKILISRMSEKFTECAWEADLIWPYTMEVFPEGKLNRSPDFLKEYERLIAEYGEKNISYVCEQGEVDIEYFTNAGDPAVELSCMGYVSFYRNV